MSNIFKLWLGVAIVAVIAVGAYWFPKVQNLVGTSPVGTTSQTAKFYSTVFSLAGTASSTSILNQSANDYYVTSIKIGCESIGTSQTYLTGAGLSKLTLTVATSSTGSPISNNANANTVGAGSTTISTSTPNFTIASSTTVNSQSSLVNNIWTAGSYMTFYLNATNTATCTLGVDAFSS